MMNLKKKVKFQTKITKKLILFALKLKIFPSSHN